MRTVHHGVEAQALLQALDEKHTTSQARMRGARETHDEQSPPRFGCSHRLGTYSNRDPERHSLWVAAGHMSSVH